MPATPSLQASPPLLEFEAARLTLDADLPPTRPLDLRLSPGELVMVDATDVPRSAALADAACGLAPPASGRVSFLGHDWSTVPPDSYAEWAHQVMGGGYARGGPAPRGHGPVPRCRHAPPGAASAPCTKRPPSTVAATRGSDRDQSHANGSSASTHRSACAPGAIRPIPGARSASAAPAV